MLATNDIEHNGIHPNGVAHLDCASDYEPAPTPDPTPQPQPGWRSQYPTFTHHVQWVDGDQKQHGLTIRSDDADEIFAVLKALKHIIRKSKEKASAEAPAAVADVGHDAAPEPDADDKPASKPCPLHPHSLAYRRESKHGGHFYSHRLPEGSWCNGKARP